MTGFIIWIIGYMCLLGMIWDKGVSLKDLTLLLFFWPFFVGAGLREWSEHK
jgi:hypothetical protein